MADEKTPAEAAKEAEIKAMQDLADETNKGRSGKGTRVRVGQTRGKNPKVISWESFDTDYPESLPSDAAEFLSLTKTTDDRLFTAYCIDGYNAAMYAAASDVLSEYLEPNWPDAFAKQFKTNITTFVAMTGVSIEEAVSIVKPKVQRAFEAKLAAK